MRLALVALAVLLFAVLFLGADADDTRLKVFHGDGHIDQ